MQSVASVLLVAAAIPSDATRWLVGAIVHLALLNLIVVLWFCRARMTRPMLLVVLATVAGSAYANLAFLVQSPSAYRFFPPFEPGRNQNQVDHLGAEYFNIASALANGRGYADPFRVPTGPTAWMPPALPTLQAALLWGCEGDRAVVTTLIVLLQTLTLIGTGWLVLALVQ